MRNNPWTEAEKQTLIELFPTHTTEHVAKVLKRPMGAVYAAATRFGIVKFKRAGMSITDKILQVCAEPKGKRLSELIAVTGSSGNNLTNTALWLIGAKRLYKAGIVRHFRFFTHEADAKAWDLEAPAVFAEHQRKAAEHRRVYNKERARKEREAKAAMPKPPRKPRPAPVPKAKPEPKPRVKPEPKVKAEPKPRAAPFKKPATDKRSHIHITNRSKEQEAPKAAKVVWPEHVKVQVHPTPPSRFDFTPPPGWRGQITHDWMNRRLGAAS